MRRIARESGAVFRRCGQVAVIRDRPAHAIATGAAILAKRKLSLALTLFWTIAFLYLLWGNGPLSNLASDFFLNIAVLIGLFAFQCLLLARGLLR